MARTWAHKQEMHGCRNDAREEQVTGGGRRAEHIGLEGRYAGRRSAKARSRHSPHAVCGRRRRRFLDPAISRTESETLVPGHVTGTAARG